MDGSLAIEDNRAALKRIVAQLVEMAGMAEPPASPPSARSGRGGRREASGGGRDGGDALGGQVPLIAATRRPDTPRPSRTGHAGGGEAGTPVKVIPRFLWLTILRLLRPAEAAARRLIIAAARGLAVPPPRLRKPVPQTATDAAERRRLGLAVMFVPGGARSSPAKRGVRRTSAERGGGGAGAEGGAGTAESAAPRIPAFRLFDPPRRLALFGRRRRRTCPPHAAPRIMYPGLVEPHRLPPPPGPHDLVGATRVISRIAALAAALDDLPAQAKRFARWKARADAARLQESGQDWKPRRTPIRRGRLPGGRLWRFDPAAIHPAKIREVDRILAHAHALAVYALDYPDTS